MSIDQEVAALIRHYPRIYFACHQRHRRDPRTRRVISEHQARVLDHLDPADPTLVGELADHLGVTASTVSLTLDRLEREGLVLRLRNDRDRRRVGVLLTPAGVRMKNAGSVLEPSRVRALLKRLSPGERADCLAALARLARVAEEMMASFALRSRRGTAS